jgi:hypothetical protein
LASLGRLAGYHVIQFEPTALERAVFTVGGGFNLAVDRLRMINRRILGRMGLERVLQWDERRAYRNRLEPVAEDVEYNRQRRPEHWAGVGGRRRGADHGCGGRALLRRRRPLSDRRARLLP